MSAFNIVCPTPSFKLKQQDDGFAAVEFPHTVSNQLRKEVKARSEVVPDERAKADWFSISGERERKFASDGNEVFAVKLTVPKTAAPPEGSPPVSYSFHLLVYNVEKPNDEFANGPTISFQVPPIVKKPPRRIWPYVAIAGAVVVLAAGAFAISQIIKKPGLNKPCDHNQCASELVCLSGTCKGDVGHTCAAADDCSSIKCEGSVCKAFASGEPCLPGNKCPENMTCATVFNNVGCFLKEGEVCDVHLRCATEWCKHKRCTKYDGKCIADDDCRKPFHCHQSNCVLANGETCDNNALCESGLCSGGKCMQPVVVHNCVPDCPTKQFCNTSTGQCERILDPVILHRDSFERRVLTEHPDFAVPALPNFHVPGF